MYEQIASNKRRTWLIMFMFVAFVVAITTAFVWGLGLSNWFVPIAIVVAIVLAWTAYWNSAKIALAASRARPAEGREFARYHNLVEGLTLAAGIPKPALYVVDDTAPNAFATGRNPKHAAVAVTTGLLEKMSRIELEAVLAHELSHIRNYDILVSTIAVTLVGTVALIADVGLRMAFWGSAGRRRSSSGGGGVLAIFSLLLVVLAPILARAMRAAVSRRREFLADASAALITRYPPGLISALEKLRDDTAVVRSASRATEQMWIESPLDVKASGRNGGWNRLFSTHPPLEDRIAALQEM